ncbi:putative monovalent cation/H+ antiporter subunit A [compost metagenome]
MPLLGDMHVPSALFFDIGVFALVLGATMLILTALAHQSIRSHRWADEQEEKEAQARAAAEAEEAAAATGGAR